MQKQHIKSNIGNVIFEVILHMDSFESYNTQGIEQNLQKRWPWTPEKVQ